MSTELAIKDTAIVEQVVLHGDLAELSPADRVAYYARVCDSMGLNPFTRPFEFIKLNNKLTLYARKDATDQLRSLRGVSIKITGKEVIEGIYTVTAQGTMGNRIDESTGSVTIAGLTGEFKANAMMKAETKAKRRVTLSIVGLGWLDETEVADIPAKDIKVVSVDVKTGEILPDTQKPVSSSTPSPVDSGSGTSTPEPAKTPIIDEGWLEDSLKTLKPWSASKYIKEKYGLTGDKIRDVVAQFSKEQATQFTKEVQDRLDMKNG